MALALTVAHFLLVKPLAHLRTRPSYASGMGACPLLPLRRAKTASCMGSSFHMCGGSRLRLASISPQKDSKSPDCPSVQKVTGSTFSRFELEWNTDH